MKNKSDLFIVMKINDIKASVVLDSRNKETIKVDIVLNNTKVFAIAPNGTSKSKKEVRDFSIKGIDYSVKLINKIGKEIIKSNLTIEKFGDLSYIEEIIKKYDKSNNYRIVGGNSVYALEAAMIKAASFSQEIPPWKFLLDGNKRLKKIRPIGNCIGGGKHSKEKIKPEFQEFLIIPNSETFFKNYLILQQAYKEVERELMKEGKLSHHKTIENAFVVSMEIEEIFELLTRIKNRIIDNFNEEMDIGVDIAANSFYKNRVYEYKTTMKKLNRSRQLEYVKSLIDEYNLYYVEDPFYDEDFESFSKLTKVKSNKCLIVGDDLTATNPGLIERALKKKAINAVIIKPNQVGSLLKTKQAVDIAKKNGLTCIVSHRSGETIDNFISDIAVGWNIPFIKAGIKGKEREIKLKRIIAIEREFS